MSGRPTEAAQAALRAVRAGIAPAHVAARYGISPGHLRRMMRKAGMPDRRCKPEPPNP